MNARVARLKREQFLENSLCSSKITLIMQEGAEVHRRLAMIGTYHKARSIGRQRILRSTRLLQDHRLIEKRRYELWRGGESPVKKFDGLR